MFLTIESMRMRVPHLPGVYLWRGVELELLIPLLLVSMTLRETARELPLPCTFLVQPEELEALLASDEFELDGIDLLSPSKINGSSGWKLEPLQELWRCSEPDLQGSVAWLFRVPNGTYSDSMDQTPTEDLGRLKRIFCLQRAPNE